MFVVVGATGHTGSVVAETLLSKKQPVRVVVRSADKGSSWKAKGAEVAVATYQDREAMAKAFEGTTGIYLLVPPNYQAQAWLVEQQRTMDQAAEAIAAGGRAAHVVFLSSVGGHLAEGTGPIRAVRYGEQQLRTVAKNLTVLRPCSFMENLAPSIGMVKGQGMLPTFLDPSTKIPMVATKDIGRTAAEQLLIGGKGTRIIELAGPEDYSPNQAAEALGKLLGKQVSVQHAPLSAVVPTFTSFGFSHEAARLFEEMYTAFSKGTLVYENPSSLVRGTVTLSEALQDMVS